MPAVTSATHTHTHLIERQLTHSMRAVHACFKKCPREEARRALSSVLRARRTTTSPPTCSTWSAPRPLVRKGRDQQFRRRMILDCLNRGNILGMRLALARWEGARIKVCVGAMGGLEGRGGSTLQTVGQSLLWHRLAWWWTLSMREMVVTYLRGRNHVAWENNREMDAGKSGAWLLVQSAENGGDKVAMPCSCSSMVYGCLWYIYLYASCL